MESRKKKKYWIWLLISLMSGSCVKEPLVSSSLSSSFSSTSISSSPSSTSALSTSSIDALYQEKEKAKQKIETYKSLDDYLSSEQNLLLEEITKAKAKIEHATSVSEIQQILNEFYQASDALKTKKQYEKEELENYIDEKIQAVKSAVNLDDYEKEEHEFIQKLQEQVIAEIRLSKTKEEVEQIFYQYKKDLSNYPTKLEKEQERKLKIYQDQCVKDLKNEFELIFYKKEERETVKNLLSSWETKILQTKSIEETNNSYDEAKNELNHVGKDVRYVNSLLKGAQFSFSSSSEETVSAIRVEEKTHDWSGEGIYIRLKNIGSVGFYTGCYINEVDSDRMALNTDAQYVLYQENGKKEVKQSLKGYGHYLYIPLHFNGWIYIPYSEFSLLEDYGSGNRQFDFSNIFAFYLDIATSNHSSDYQSQFLLGDIYVLQDNALKAIVDTDEITITNYENYYKKDYNFERIHESFYENKRTSKLFSHLENETGSEKYYNYCPSIFEEDGVRHIYYCANQKNGNVTDYVAYRHGEKNELGIWEYSSISYVLSPSSSGWDSRHVCDPSVIKGEFTYQNENYSYLMAYLGCLTSDSTQNEIGLAVSKKPEGPFMKIDSNPICDYELNGSSGFQWGYGQPSLVSIDQKGKVMLFYTVGDGTQTYQRLERYDLSNLNDIQPLDERAITVLTKGLVNRNNTQDFISNADFAYDPITKRIYMIRDDHPTLENANVSVSVSLSYLEDRYKNYSLHTPGYILTHIKSQDQWTNVQRIDETYAQQTLNHNSALVTNPYGWLLTGNEMDVLFTGAMQNDTIWNTLKTYRIYQTTIKKPE